MAWTYSGNPASSSKDAVRFLVGDTRVDDSLVQDEEIAWALAQNSNIYGAAAIIAESISAYFATQATSVVIGPIREDYGQRAKDYASKAKELSGKSSETGTLNIYAGGIYSADKLVNSEDTSLTVASFTIGQDDGIL